VKINILKLLAMTSNFRVFATFVITEVWILVVSWVTCRHMYSYLHIAFHTCCYCGGIVINKDINNGCDNCAKWLICYGNFLNNVTFKPSLVCQFWRSVQFRTTTVRRVVPVHLSAWNNLNVIEYILKKFDIHGFFRNLSRILQFDLTVTGALHDNLH
jgi:hypothetical protein